MERISFSWRYGVEGDCGRQGYHGLKGKIHDEFIRLGELAVLPWSGSMVRKAEKAGRFYYLYTFIDAPYTGTYRVLTDSVVPTNVYVDGDKRPLEKNSSCDKAFTGLYWNMKMLVQLTSCCKSKRMFVISLFASLFL